MHKLFLFVLVLTFVMCLHALQLDQEAALSMLFQVKHALNRAAHAAAQQIDPLELKHGVLALDPLRAEEEALRYLQMNLRLDERLFPLPGSYLQSPVEWKLFHVVNNGESFPFHFHHEHEHVATLNRPGVIIWIRVLYPRMFQILQPITWDIWGSAELAYEL